MQDHWAEEFVQYAENYGIPCSRVRYRISWLETVDIARCRCFIKCMSYNEQRHLYFQGVDPDKLSEKGEAVVLCGGRKGELADVFIVPWKQFFGAVAQSEAINTYRDRKYFQYKFSVRDRDCAWIASFQGGTRPVLDLTDKRFDPKNAVLRFRAIECRADAAQIDS
ncbi:MAG: hypothetical protein ABSH28_21150 [Acidobacteriota bacterium]|jgi:hypothetical protein